MEFKNKLVIVIWVTALPLMMFGYFMVTNMNDCTSIEPGTWHDKCVETIQRGQFMAVSVPVGLGLFLTIMTQLFIIPNQKNEDKNNDLI